MLRRALMAVLCLVCPAAGFSGEWDPPQNLSRSLDTVRGGRMWDVGQSMAIDSAGKVHVTWVDWNDDVEKHLYYSNNVSGAFSAPARIPVPGYWFYVTDATRLAIASDDTLHLALTVKQNSSNYQGILYLTKPPGGAWSQAQQISPFDGSRFCYANSIAVTPAGDVCAIYQDTANTPAVYARYRPAGGSFQPEEQLFVTPEAGRFPSGWVRAVGEDLWCAFTTDRHGVKLRVRTGGVWGAVRTVADFPGNQSGSPANIAWSPLTGEMAAVYGCNPGSGLDFQIYLRSSSDGGLTWGPEQTISPGPSLDRAATAAFDRAGNLHVAWYGRTSDSAQDDVYYRWRTPAGAWSAVENVTVSAGRTSATWESIRIRGTQVHLICADAGNDTGVPGYEDIVYTTRTPAPDTWPPSSVTGFTASAGEERATLNWTNPPDADFSSTVIRMSTAGYPATPWAGAYVAEQYAAPGSTGTKLVIPLSAGVPCYFSAFALDRNMNVSAAAYAQATPLTDVTAPGEVIGFSAAADAGNNITLTWTNPPDPDLKGLLIRAKTTGCPASVGDGELVLNRAALPGAQESFVWPAREPDTAYCFRALTYDARPNLSAGATAAVSTTSARIGQVERMEDGQAVALYGKVVTSVQGTYFYVQEPDRSAGIRVTIAPAGLACGDVVNVFGMTGSHKPAGTYTAERQIVQGAASPAFVKTGAVPGPAALGMSGRSVGGQADGLMPGVAEGAGTNNMGLLVRVWGRVTYVSGSTIWMDDGCGVPDIGGRIGVVCTLAAGSAAVAAGDAVQVTGVIEGSIPLGFTTNRRFVRARTPGDLVILDQDR